MTAGPRVGIVGLGLIGGSLARALRRDDRPVVAATRTARTASGARAIGVEVVDGVAAVAARSDVVVVATALGVLADAVAEAVTAAAACAHRPTVTDVGSIKTPIAAAVPAAHRDLYVGGHPMAGTEHSGWDASEADLFHRRTWALAVDGGTDLARWADVARVALSAGSTVVPVDPAEHDTAVAVTSHVPYVLAAVSAAAVDGAPHPALLRSLAAGSFASLTRVAGGHPTLGAEMALGNHEAVAAHLDEVAAALTGAATALRRGDDHSVEHLFGRGRAARQALDAADHDVTSTDGPRTRDGLLALGRAGGRVTAVGPATPDEVEVAADVLSGATP